jgi:hypothetical protein
MNHANVLRAKGFEEAMLPDPLVIRAWMDGLMQLPGTDNYLQNEDFYNVLIDEMKEMRHV